MALLGALLLGPGTAAAQGPAGGPTPSPGAGRHVVAAVLTVHAVRVAPDLGSAPLASIGSRRPLGGARTTLPVLGRATDGAGRAWLRVQLPGRRLTGRAPPATGWIKAAGTRRFTTAWELVVRRGARQVDVLRDGRRVRRFGAIVGAGPTPTPLGSFFVEENLRLGASRIGAPFALALSARSAVLQEFDGGPGQIALHGRGNVGGRLGTAASHGCVRLDDAAITWLAARIRPGVPVRIVE